MRTNFTLWMILILTVLFGCSTAKFGWEKEPQTDQPPAETGTGMIEDFDPLSLEEEDIQVKPRPEATEADETPRVLKEAVPETEEAVPESELIQGYRVQLFASETEQNANEAKKRAIFKFDERVYLIFQGAYYRLYVGDFVDRKDAEKLALEAQRKGFDGAWVVPARVNPNNVPQHY